MYRTHPVIEVEQAPPYECGDFEDDADLVPASPFSIFRRVLREMPARSDRSAAVSSRSKRSALISLPRTGVPAE